MRSRLAGWGCGGWCRCVCEAIGARHIRRASVPCYEFARFGSGKTRSVSNAQAVLVGQRCGQKKCRKLLPSVACDVVLFVVVIRDPLLDLVVGATRFLLHLAAS